MDQFESIFCLKIFRRSKKITFQQNLFSQIRKKCLLRKNQNHLFSEAFIKIPQN